MFTPKFLCFPIQLATPKCTTDIRKVTTGNDVRDLDCIWRDEMAGADSCDQCERHGLNRAWYGEALDIYLCEFCLPKPETID